MPLQATSGAASQDAFGGNGVAVVPTYIEDVFSTYLYTGNGSTQTITNNIDLSTKGGLVWIKCRSDAGSNHGLTDTVRGATKSLFSDQTYAELTGANDLKTFNSNGFSIGDGTQFSINNNNSKYASWTFREQPKFFDIVTWSGDSTAGRQITHNLGSTPGMVVIKSLVADNWCVWHRSLTAGNYIVLNSTAAQTTAGAVNRYGNGTTTVNPNSTYITVGPNGEVNQTGNNYVAYIFAHDAGGFGLTGTDNVISCGSFTTDGSGNATVTLGYEPQWLMFKASTTTQDWYILDSMRGMTSGGAEQTLRPNTSGAEDNFWNASFKPTATGFSVNAFNSSTTYIYIAIRRGPMKVPTTGTSVFSPVATSGNPSSITAGFPVDFALGKEVKNSTGYGNNAIDRLRGGSVLLETNTTGAEYTSQTFKFDSNTQFLQSAGGLFYGPSIYWLMRRAPSFMDVVCYTGDSTTPRSVSHNLAAIPELMILKKRSTTGEWFIYSNFTSTSFKYANFNTSGFTSRLYTDVAEGLSSQPTSTALKLDDSGRTNGSGITYVTYLFATCAGVSKVGSYTGTAATLQIDCGFTGGARFVLIKRTDSTGAWYVWDTARGIVSGNDPYLLLNSTAAEVTNTDYIDTYSAGFEISSTAPAAINASGGSFIFFAVA